MSRWTPASRIHCLPGNGSDGMLTVLVAWRDDFDDCHDIPSGWRMVMRWPCGIADGPRLAEHEREEEHRASKPPVVPSPGLIVRQGETSLGPGGDLLARAR